MIIHLIGAEDHAGNPTGMGKCGGECKHAVSHEGRECFCFGWGRCGRANPNSESSMHYEEHSKPGDTLENPIVFTMRKSSKPMSGRALDDVGPEDSASNVSSRASSTARTAKLQARRAEMDSIAAAEAAEMAVMRAEFEAAQLRQQQDIQRQQFEAQQQQEQAKALARRAALEKEFAQQLEEKGSQVSRGSRSSRGRV